MRRGWAVQIKMSRATTWTESMICWLFLSLMANYFNLLW